MRLAELDIWLLNVGDWRLELELEIGIGESRGKERRGEERGGWGEVIVSFVVGRGWWRLVLMGSRRMGCNRIEWTDEQMKGLEREERQEKEEREEGSIGLDSIGFNGLGPRYFDDSGGIH